MRQSLCITVLTDIHHYSVKNGVSGKAYEKANSKSQILLAESGEVLDSLFSKIASDNRSDIVLISGDLTSNGDLESHKEIIRKLRLLKASGKRVYVITATHDFRNSGVTDAYSGNEKISVPTATRGMLFDMYREFGPDEAIAVHRDSMSYVVQLQDGYRLFALNDDTNGNGKSGFSDECFEWISSQAKKARDDNQLIVAMTHHPLISPSPLYKVIGGGNMLGDYHKRIEQLADLGISFVLTGHTHIHNISEHYSKTGNRLYDICTGSPIGYPGVMRLITFDDKVNVTTEYTPTPLSFESRGENIKEALERQFIGVIRNMIEYAAVDTDKLADAAQAISIKPKVIYKFAWIIKPVFKILNSLKVGTVAKWTKKETGLRKSDYEAVKDIRVVDIITELVLNLYAGESKYPPQTPIYKITVGFLHIIDSILRVLHINMKKLTKEVDRVTDLIKPLLYNEGIDSYTAELTVPEYYTDSQNKNKEIKTKSLDFVKNSKKGLPILMCMIFAVVLFLPIWFIVILFAYCINAVKYRKKIK